MRALAAGHVVMVLLVAAVAMGSPVPPEDVTAADIGDGRVLVSWQAEGNEDLFIVERDPPRREGPISVKPPRSFVVDEPGDGEFAYRVRAEGAGGTSSQSGWARVQVSTAGGARSVRGMAGILRGLSVGTDGWTELRPSADTRVIYVSSSQGRDDNDGLSESSPKRTIAAGYRMLRDGYPDWLLLKRGDVWEEGQLWWTRSGRSPAERMVVRSYGAGPRPQWRTGTQSGIAGNRHNGARSANLVFADLHLVQHENEGTHGGSGFQLLNAWEDVLIENCVVENYRVNMCFQAFSEGIRQANIAVRRNIIVDAISTGGGHAQGIFADGVDGLLLEENVLDRNGWREDIPTADIFRHNVYVQTRTGDDKGCTNVVTRRNITARASATGLLQRPGGAVEANLFLANPIGLSFGHRGGPLSSGVVKGNVVLDARDIRPGEERGYGIWITEMYDTEVTGNIIAHQRGGTYNVAGINVDGTYEDIVVRDNTVYDWTHGDGAGGHALSWYGRARGGVRIEGNHFQQVRGGFVVRHQAPVEDGFRYVNNTYYAAGGKDAFARGMSYRQWTAQSGEVNSSFARGEYPDPARTIERYMEQLGRSGGLEAFLAEARKQDRPHWREEFTAAAVIRYVREGFGREESSGRGQ